MQTSYQVESQTESLSAMAIAFAQDTKDFQSPNDVFDFHALRRQLSICLLLCFVQPVQFAIFLRQNHFLRCALQTPIAQITAQSGFFAEPVATHLIQLVFVRFAVAEKRRHNLFRFFGNQNLSFQRMPLFLAAVEPLLFFFGRSIKLSVTSTIAYLIELSSRSRFLPGKENLPDLIQISSMRRTSRDTFDSCNFQSRPRWNIVRYSRQKQSVSRIWFSTDKLLFLPRLFSCLHSTTTWHIAAKVSRLTPHKRLKSPGFKFLTSS
jgi:hypothetical protein